MIWHFTQMTILSQHVIKGDGVLLESRTELTTKFDFVYYTLNTSVTAAPAVHCCEKLLLVDFNIERVIINFGQQYYQL